MHYDVRDINWLPIVSLMIFISFYSFGWGPIPWALMGEMFSAEVKAKASSITVCIAWGLVFVFSKYFSNVVTSYGSHTAFWLFSICSIISLLFNIFILPETKGKSLKEIQDKLNGITTPQDSAEMFMM